MKQWKFFGFVALVVLSLSGCAVAVPQSLVVDPVMVPPAGRLFSDNQSIATAYDAYRAERGEGAKTIEDLVVAGHLPAVPQPDCSVLANCTDKTRYQIGSWGDNDGNGRPDIVLDIIDGGNPEVPLCVAFNATHTSLRAPWRNPALGGNDPGSWPVNDRSFCVCWTENCDTDPAFLEPGGLNIITLLEH